MINRLVRVLERPLVIDDKIAQADAIVVLGAPLGPGGELTQILEERVEAAAMLWHAGAASVVVASGGVTHGAPRAEADAIAEALTLAGVPDVLVEGASKTTVENARFTAAMLAPLGARSVWLVTQPFHGRRSALLFRRAGLQPRVWHITDSVQYSDRRRALRWVMREYAAWGKLLVGR